MFGNVSGVVWIILMIICIVIIICCLYIHIVQKHKQVEIGQITATTISGVDGSHCNINAKAKIGLQKEPPLNIKRSNDNLGPYRSVGV